MNTIARAYPETLGVWVAGTSPAMTVRGMRAELDESYARFLGLAARSAWRARISAR